LEFDIILLCSPKEIDRAGLTEDKSQAFIKINVPSDNLRIRMTSLGLVIGAGWTQGPHFPWVFARVLEGSGELWCQFSGYSEACGKSQPEKNET
jgi:hypothetical protein